MVAATELGQCLMPQTARRRRGRNSRQASSLPASSHRTVSKLPLVLLVRMLKLLIRSPRKTWRSSAANVWHTSSSGHQSRRGAHPRAEDCTAACSGNTVHSLAGAALRSRVLNALFSS
mmetsp:Transcript_5854/g.13861  ORF Transcript_5854/g.13861 Transcript_5854/m.13861 type:complete len:118 (+) Transcript_5854:163-516(+)